MDRRHQRDGRNTWSKGFSASAEKVFGKWNFYKMNLTSQKVESVKEGKAMLEISTANSKERIFENVRSSDSRKNHFSNSYHSTAPNRDVDWFDAVAEMKSGGKIYTKQFVYWAERQAPSAKPQPEDAGMVQLDNRMMELVSALSRGLDSQLEVFNGWERNTYHVKNRKTGNEYECVVKTVDSHSFGKCSCPDFQHRRRICKHLSHLLVQLSFEMVGRVAEVA